jgi:hypothetical protein
MELAFDAAEERVLKLQVLAFIEEHCRGLTLHDVREWYQEAFALDRPQGTDPSRPPSTASV